MKHLSFLVCLMMQTEGQELATFLNLKNKSCHYFYFPTIWPTTEELTAFIENPIIKGDKKIQQILSIKYPSELWLSNNLITFMERDAYQEYLNYMLDLNDYPEKRIVIIIPSFNNQSWTENCLISALEQNYTNYSVILRDDCSTDQSFAIAQNLLLKKKYQNLVIKSNEYKLGKVGNLFCTINNIDIDIHIDDDDIIVILDGDDQFAHKNLLKLINKLYQKEQCAITYGGFVSIPQLHFGTNKDIPKEVIQENKIRQFSNHTSQQTSFYAKLFREIKIKDLLFDNAFIKTAGDLAIMFPMLELAEDKIFHIKFPVYLYNKLNPINDHKVSAQLQRKVDAFLRNKKSYKNKQIKTNRVLYEFFNMDAKTFFDLSAHPEQCPILGDATYIVVSDHYIDDMTIKHALDLTKKLHAKLFYKLRDKKGMSNPYFKKIYPNMYIATTKKFEALNPEFIIIKKGFLEKMKKSINKAISGDIFFSL